MNTDDTLPPTKYPRLKWAWGQIVAHPHISIPCATFLLGGLLGAFYF